MSDLNEELKHMAADGANRATPLAIAEVVRKGNRRRARTIGQRSIGGLSMLGISAAVIVGGAAHPFHGGADHPSGTAAGVTTLTETSATSAGTMTAEVKYRNGPPGKVKLLGVTFTGTTTASIRKADVFVEFGPIVQRGLGRPAAGCRSGQIDGLIRELRLHKGHSFTGSLRINFDLPPVKGIGIACGGDLMTVSVVVHNPGQPIRFSTVLLTEGFVLDR